MIQMIMVCFMNTANKYSYNKIITKPLGLFENDVHVDYELLTSDDSTSSMPIQLLSHQL